MSDKNVVTDLPCDQMSNSVSFLMSDPVATAACFVAFLALVTSAWQAYQQRKHNRLSVRPFVSRFSQRGKGKDITIGFKNMGLGAAIIEKVTFMVEGENIEIKRLSDFTKLFKKLGLEHLNDDFICCAVGKYAVLAPNESVSIIELPKSSYDEGDHSLIAETLASIVIHASYQSMYKEKFTTKSPAP